MRAKNSPVLDEDDAPELTPELAATLRPGAEVLPAEVLAAFGKKRGRPKADDARPKVTIRLSPKVIEHYKRGGEKGWQTRLNADLEKLVGKSA